MPVALSNPAMPTMGAPRRFGACLLRQSPPGAARPDARREEPLSAQALEGPRPLTPADDPCTVAFQRAGDPRSQPAPAAAWLRPQEIYLTEARRPAIALTLGEPLDAQVHLERLGPREVALFVVGRGPLSSPATRRRLVKALRARGLTVRHATRRPVPQR